uniref:seipin-2-like isoform X1 n=1 Tax=Erigeron canadensis TaxID=72917 RepID=UPI001CB9CB56|nr:seipin-2-like isoform X1 [Erigeron canadensis]
MVQQQQQEEFRDAHDSFDDPLSKTSFPPSSPGLRRRRLSNASPVRRKPHKFSSNLKDVNNNPKLNGNYLNLKDVIKTDSDLDDQIVTESSVTVDSPNSNLAPLVVLLKVFVYQANLLVGFVTFPIWVVYYAYLLLLVITRRVRRYTIRKISRFLGFCIGNVKRVVYGWIKRNSNSVWKLCQRVGLGLLQSVSIGFILVGLLIFAFVTSGVLMKCFLDEPVERFEELSFDYTKDAPIAYMPIMSCPQSFCDECDGDFESGKRAQLGRVIPLGHKLLATVSLTLPESDYNRNLGIFQVRVDILSPSGKFLASTTQPCMLRFKSLPIRLLMTFLKLFPVISGYSSETQALAIKFKGYIERVTPTSCLRVVLEPRAAFAKGGGVPEIYTAYLKLESQLPLLKRILWSWKLAIYVWTSIVIFIGGLVFMMICCTPLLVPWLQPMGMRSNNNGSR